MKTEFKLRPYQGKDDERQLELLELPRKYIRQYTNSPPFYYFLRLLGICTDYLYLMTQNDSAKVVGTILLRKRINIFEAGYTWKMHAVYVAPELRGRGLGVKLVFHALEKLRERRVGEVSLKVDESNKAAIQLYKKCGFIEKTRRRGQLIFFKHVT